MGLQALYQDIGVALPLHAWAGSSAAIGVACRQGLGKLCHLECHSLWAKQRLRHKDFQLLKVQGESNPADLFNNDREPRAKPNQLIGFFNRRSFDGRFYPHRRFGARRPR